jgi:alkanesulfonate monooxygenase SsuD/methylene tetrahydromethanopterin reductase-like flavin-dependent oxidoreductase (luciferase family)
MLEAYTLLGGIAAKTKRVMLGTMVTGVTYRNPAILAKTVTTLDIVSGGRAMLGIGAAWNDVEHAGYGVDFPPIGEREDRLEEALTICKAMFTEERPSFEGRHYRIDRALNNPRPIRPGGPRIMVGGGGEKRTLKIAARFADITNWFGTLEEAAPSSRSWTAIARRSAATRPRSCAPLASRSSRSPEKRTRPQVLERHPGRATGDVQTRPGR